jgi:tetratricopeptide (TPR) repeat protein
MPLSSQFVRLLLTALLIAPASALALPFVPTSDQQVLERLPGRAADPRQRELRELREQLARNPRDVEAAVRLARRYYAESDAEGDPRYVGYAQAALAPWWDLPDPPIPARLMRAVLRQFGHEFDPALADLSAVLKVQPEHGEALSWQAAIFMVRAQYPQARQACERLAPQASALIAVACLAYVDSLTGRAAAAATALRTAVRDDDEAEPDELVWALTRLAEIEDRRGESTASEAAFRQALALGVEDVYLLAAYADFLLDRGRPAEVLTLLKDKERSDLLLLRLALAGKAAKAPGATAWADALAARFDAARLRGDALHQKEEGRFALAIQGQAQRALTLARANYAVQREPADARVLLEAAIAARQPAAAAPVLTWMAESRVESVVLGALASQVKGMP